MGKNISSKLIWELKCLSDIQAIELYNIFCFRNSILVHEAKKAFQDADGNDNEALHLIGYSNNQLSAYVRLFVFNTDQRIKISRICIAQNFRSEEIINTLLSAIAANMPQLAHGTYHAEIESTPYSLEIYKLLLSISQKYFTVTDTHLIGMNSSSNDEKYALTATIAEITLLRTLLLPVKCMFQLEWEVRTLNDIHPQELYKILCLRNRIFVAEQNCYFKDADGRDFAALHIIGKHNDQLVAYARLLFPEDNEGKINFGRVCVIPDLRGKGIGEKLVTQLLEQIDATPKFRACRISINAESYITKLYKKFGFEETGIKFNNAGVDIIEMERKSLIDLPITVSNMNTVIFSLAKQPVVTALSSDKHTFFAEVKDKHQPENNLVESTGVCHESFNSRMLKIQK